MARQALGVASYLQTNRWGIQNFDNVVSSAGNEPPATRWRGGARNNQHGWPNAAASSFTPAQQNTSRDPLTDNDPWIQPNANPFVGATQNNTSAGWTDNGDAQWNTHDSIHC